MPAAVVSGSSRGIGREIALRFAGDGYDVAVNYRESEKKAAEVVDQIADETDRRGVAMQADVSDADEAKELVDEAYRELGSLDHVVNNAGANQHLYTPELPVEDFQRLLDVNVTSAFAVTKAALPYLMESEVAVGPSIINMSSIVVHTGAAIQSHYATSKIGLLGLTKSHAAEFAPDVRVNAIAPGLVETDMTADRTETEREEEKSQIPLGRYGTPDEIAHAASYLRDATFVTGETLNVNGGAVMR